MVDDFFASPRPITIALEIISGKKFSGLEKLTFFKQYTTSIAIVAWGKVSPKYSKYSFSPLYFLKIKKGKDLHSIVETTRIIRINNVFFPFIPPQPN